MLRLSEYNRSHLSFSTLFLVAESWKWIRYPAHARIYLCIRNLPTHFLIYIYIFYIPELARLVFDALTPTCCATKCTEKNDFLYSFFHWRNLKLLPLFPNHNLYSSHRIWVRRITRIYMFQIRLWHSRVVDAIIHALRDMIFPRTNDTIGFAWVHLCTNARASRKSIWFCGAFTWRVAIA